MRLLLTLGAATLLTACAGNLNVGEGTDEDAGGRDGDSNDGGPVTVPADGGLPCEVAQLISSHCIGCHGSPPAGGAPMPLLTRADLLASSPRDSTLSQAQRSVIRMRATSSPMPPSGPPPAALVDAFEAWVTAGLPAGSCEPIDAGPPALTCLSKTFRARPTAPFDNGSATMAPGMACISCHMGMNFMGQNPGGAMEKAEEARQFMGTVFRSLHEQDLCAPNLGIAATVQILDPDGGVLGTFPVNSGGNFFGNLTLRPALFRARVVTAQGTREMATAQTSGDCNTCHTAEGREGAPGRIFLP